MKIKQKYFVKNSKKIKRFQIILKSKKFNHTLQFFYPCIHFPLCTYDLHMLLYTSQKKRKNATQKCEIQKIFYVTLKKMVIMQDELHAWQICDVKLKRYFKKAFIISLSEVILFFSIMIISYVHKFKD